MGIIAARFQPDGRTGASQEALYKDKKSFLSHWASIAIMLNVIPSAPGDISVLLRNAAQSSFFVIGRNTTGVSDDLLPLPQYHRD